MENDEENISSFVDNYVHLSSNVIYSPISVPGAGVNVEEFESQIVAGCSCLSGVCCVKSDCICVVTYGRNYDENSKLLKEKFEGPVVECNASCVCVANGCCDNSVVRKGPLSALEIYESAEGKGKALRATTDVSEGTFMCEYAGEVIGKEEAIKRMQSLQKSDMNYIFHLKEHLADGSTILTIVDPTYIGNIGRYINHSCEPNCIVVPVRIDSPVPRLAIFTSRYVPCGEELTFDYGFDVETSNNSKKKKCLCGKSKCRQFLPFDCFV